MSYARLGMSASRLIATSAKATPASFRLHQHFVACDRAARSAAGASFSITSKCPPQRIRQFHIWNKIRAEKSRLIRNRDSELRGGVNAFFFQLGYSGY